MAEHPPLETAPWLLLRPAGAAADTLDLLRDSRVEAALDERAAAVRALDAAAARLVRATPAGRDGRRVRRLVRTRRPLPDGYAAEGEHYRAALAMLHAREAVLRDVAGRAYDAIEEALARWAANDDIVEFALLSGPDVDAARVAASECRGRRWRRLRRTLLVGRIVQRVAAKCESVSRFGPVAWQPLGRPATTGDSALRREVLLDHWAVNAIAEAMQHDVGAIGVRLADHVRIERDALVTATARHVLPHEAAVLLTNASAGAATIELVTRLAPSLGSTPEELLDLVGELLEQGVLVAEPRVPTRSQDPLAWLHRWIAERADRDPRLDSWRAYVEWLLAELARFRDATPHDRRAIAASIDDGFSQVTKTAAYRRHGQLYGGRRIFFEECAQKATAPAIAPLLEEHARALRVTVEIASWSIARATTARAAQWRSFIAERGGRAPFAAVFTALASRPDDGLEREIDAEARRRVAETLAIDEREDEIQLEERTLDRLLAAFAHDPPPFAQAQWHTVSLHARADGGLILGGIQRGVSTLTIPMFLRHCPDAAAFVERVVDEPLVTLNHLAHEVTHASIFPPVSEQVIEIELGGAAGRESPVRRIRIAELEVIGDEGNDLRLRTRDGSLDVPLTQALYERFVAMRFLPLHFGMLDAPHRPRLSAGRFVLSRRGWQLDASAVPLCYRRSVTAAEALAAVDEWRRRLGLPAEIYVRSDVERSPLWLDLRSPISALELVRSARRARLLLCEEALPRRDDLWLGDPPRHCELRILVRRTREAR